jgi:hypothetical protein
MIKLVLSTASLIDGNLGVAVTINKSADDKAQPQRALSFKTRSEKT